MSDDIIESVRAASPNLVNAIMRPLSVDCTARNIDIEIVTDRAFTDFDLHEAERVLKPYVPNYFTYGVHITKLSPDAQMVKHKISEIISTDFKAIAATMSDGDILVDKAEDGFHYTIYVLASIHTNADICGRINSCLKNYYCGEFFGNCLPSQRKAADIEVEEKPDQIEYDVPIRRFEIVNFKFIEGEKKRESAIYIADLNFVANEVVICGVIEEIREHTYTNKKGEEKFYLSFVLSDGTASVQANYFIRRKSYDKIKTLKVGDSIVCTGDNESFNGNLKYRINFIDLGAAPENFRPEKRVSKPVPAYYRHVKPRPFVDMEQTDFLTNKFVPDCLKNETFVVFDLETTGLNSSPVSGNMDKIIEIAAYKIENGEITQSFTTFVNPERKLSEEIIKLTGITEAMVKDAPTTDEVMPDFFKFCDGSILVGHNISGFDFKFVDYYCSKIGYIFERKMIDTIPLAQEQLFLSNYKLNTVADKFNITFNHHRASDDALVTAKIFIELIKLKKSLPKLT